MNADAADMRIEYALGQDIYTPVDISRADPDPRDRPYAGWLYFSIGVAAVENRHLDQLQLTLGVLGPSSLAQEIQSSVHEFIKSKYPEGWGAQLHDEPGVMLAYHRTWLGPLGTTVRGVQADLSPYVGGALGNLMTYGDGGAIFRLGPDLPDRDYGPPRIEPTAVGTGYFAPTPGLRWYLFASAGARVVLHNTFLDGNTFRDSRGVGKRPLVGDLQVGLVVSWRELRLAYTHAFRTREFEDQTSGDQFGAVTLSVQF